MPAYLLTNEEAQLQRPRGITVLAILAAIGGVLGLLTGLWLLQADYLANAPYTGPSEAESAARFGLIRTLVVLVASVAELAFAFSAWTLRAWALTPGRRAAGVVVAIVLIALATLTFLSMGV